MHEYSALITKVYDGDSVTADIDMGFKLFQKDVKLRLYGIDTPEIRGTSGIERVRAYDAREYLRELVLNKKVTIKTFKPDKYGRYLTIIMINYLGQYLSVNDLILTKDFGRLYTGGAKTEWDFKE